MLLDDLFEKLTDVSKENIIFNKNWIKLRTEYYSTQSGFCEGCGNRETCPIAIAVNMAKLNSLKEEISSFAKVSSSFSFDIKIIINRCNKFIMKGESYGKTKEKRVNNNQGKGE